MQWQCRWKEGLCPFSETCKYAHGESDLRTVADNERAAQMGSGGQQVDKRGMINMMKKTRLCQEFMTTSMCKYGDKCTFAHGQHELRAPNPAGAATQGGMRPKTGQQPAQYVNPRTCMFGFAEDGMLAVAGVGSVPSIRSCKSAQVIFEHRTPKRDGWGRRHNTGSMRAL
eukprot:1149970-Pelagomonas_calceolata.AAC.3